MTRDELIEKLLNKTHLAGETVKAPIDQSACFRNCQEIAVDCLTSYSEHAARLRYVEGYNRAGGIEEGHAWLVVDDEPWDPTAKAYGYDASHDDARQRQFTCDEVFAHYLRVRPMSVPLRAHRDKDGGGTEFTD
jgi:hypothetical protein